MSMSKTIAILLLSCVLAHGADFLGGLNTNNAPASSNYVVMILEHKTNAPNRLVRVSTLQDFLLASLNAMTNALGARIETKQQGSEVLSNLLATVARNVTNADPAYFAIINGTLWITNAAFTNITANLALKLDAANGVANNQTNAGWLTVGGAFTNKGSVRLEGTTALLGPVVADSSVNVDGALTAGSTFLAAGMATFLGAQTNASYLTVGGAFTNKGSAKFLGDVDVVGGLLAGSLEVSGPANMAGLATVSGVLTARGGVTYSVHGNLTASAILLDCANTNTFLINPGANTTLTLSNLIVGHPVRVRFDNRGKSYTLTVNGAVTWQNANHGHPSAPTNSMSLWVFEKLETASTNGWVVGASHDYEAGSGVTFTWNGSNYVISATGSSTAWDAIADPAGNGTVAFGGTQQILTSSRDSATDPAVLILRNTDASLANETALLDLQFDQVTPTANMQFLRAIYDRGGTPVYPYIFNATNAYFQTGMQFAYGPLASSPLLGTDASGRLQKITLGTGLSLAGTTLNASGGSGILTMDGLGTNTTIRSTDLGKVPLKVDMVETGYPSTNLMEVAHGGTNKMAVSTNGTLLVRPHTTDVPGNIVASISTFGNTDAGIGLASNDDLVYFGANQQLAKFAVGQGLILRAQDALLWDLASSEWALQPNTTRKHLFFRHATTETNYLVGSIFTQTATAGPTNTTTATQLLNGVGQTNFQANTLTVGKTIRVKIRGQYSTAATPGTDGFVIRIGGTTVATNNLAIPASLSDMPWAMDVEITVRTIGASGTVMVNGGVMMNTNGNQFINLPMKGATVDTTSTIDTTVAQNISVMAQTSVTTAPTQIRASTGRIYVE